MLRNDSKSAAAKEKGEFCENDANNSSKPAVWLAACPTRGRKILKGLNHSARRSPDEIGLRRVAHKMKIYPERVEANGCEGRCNPFRVGKCFGR
jgi:hypothetical protein